MIYNHCIAGILTWDRKIQNAAGLDLIAGTPSLTLDSGFTAQHKTNDVVQESSLGVPLYTES